MRFVSWAVFYEGPSDALYLDILLPRIIRDMIAREGTDLIDIPDSPAVRLNAGERSVEKIVEEACASKEAFDVIFIHADTGGRQRGATVADRADSYCAAMATRCDWPEESCITITPRHETEAWLLADVQAVVDALGYRGAPEEAGLPVDARAAERLGDPKQVLEAAVRTIAGRRRSPSIHNLFPSIAQRQRLELLRGSASFASFEARLRRALRALRFI